MFAQKVSRSDPLALRARPPQEGDSSICLILFSLLRGRAAEGGRGSLTPDFLCNPPNYYYWIVAPLIVPVFNCVVTLLVLETSIDLTATPAALPEAIQTVVPLP